MLSAISSASAGTGAEAISQARSKAVDELFKKVDTNVDGKITKDELTQALQSDSVELGSSENRPSVDQIFERLGAGSKGYITKDDAAAALENAPPPSEGAKPAARGGGRPVGGGGGGGGSTEEASTSTNYDPMDTNQDGTVTMQEKLAYISKAYTETESTPVCESTTYA